MSDDILYEVEGKVATITLNRPQSLNALSLSAQFDLHDAWIEFKNDERVVVGIVTAAGERAFCVGADLKDTGDLPSRHQDRLPHLAEGSIYPREYDLGKPVIAAVNGHALGMGAAIAVQSDLRVLSENATLGYPLVGLGMMPGALQDFWMAGPSAIAMRALYTGKPINAADAYRSGIANEVVPIADLMPTARSLAEEIAANAPLVIQAIKRAWDGQQEFREVKAWRDFTRLGKTVDASEDREEGRRAFGERRKPDWKGR